MVVVLLVVLVQVELNFVIEVSVVVVVCKSFVSFNIAPTGNSVFGIGLLITKLVDGLVVVEVDTGSFSFPPITVVITNCGLAVAVIDAGVVLLVVETEVPTASVVVGEVVVTDSEVEGTSGAFETDVDASCETVVVVVVGTVVGDDISGLEETTGVANDETDSLIAGLWVVSTTGFKLNSSSISGKGFGGTGTFSTTTGETSGDAVVVVATGSASARG